MKLINCILFLLSQKFIFGEVILDIAGFRYSFSQPFKADWFVANQYCRYRGMFLIDVPTYTEQKRVGDLIDILGAPYNDSHYWTSGNDLSEEGHFVWLSSGHPFIFTFWTSGQPDNSHHSDFNESECCVELKKNYWNDQGCHRKNYFICRNDTINHLK